MLANLELYILDEGFNILMIGNIYFHNLCKGLLQLACLFIEFLPRHGNGITPLLLTYLDEVCSLDCCSSGSSLAFGFSCIELPPESCHTHLLHGLLHKIHKQNIKSRSRGS